MICRFVVPVEVDASTLPYGVREKVVKNERGLSILPAGTLYETPHAAHFCLNGMAEPADDECRAKVNRTPGELADLQRRYVKIEAGLLPEDIPLFDAGYISGYHADGSYKPGPNWDEYQEMLLAQAEAEAEALPELE